MSHVAMNLTLRPSFFIFQLPHSISLPVTFCQLKELIFVFICFSFQEKKIDYSLVGSDQKQNFDGVSSCWFRENEN